MALVPSNYWRDWWDDFERPHRLLDRYFGVDLHREDIIQTVSSPSYRDYFRPWRRLLDQTKSDLGVIESNSDKFRIEVDVHYFSPSEILVKTVGNSVIIQAEHEDKRDRNNYTSRKFMRRYDLPKGVDVTRVMSTLSTDGILTVTAPKIPIPPPGERIIPVNRSYFPALK
ncbi:protein lethal(2)essential for life-like [Chelonus insularis]|uniref:protein lethal(2)essential for life-like n=1 Tax=Chelonus insularis TaxID=460826 RepID=UPI00158CEA60|nr:protein lethal(2)essential for life-like [Chelonus insularis]